MLEYYSKATQDPDQVLATWLREGAPIGILNEVTHTGVFPLSDPKLLADPDTLGTDPEGWRNYVSAEDNAEKVLEILQENVDARHGTWFDSYADLTNAVQGTPVFNKFGLIIKEKKDGSTKYRVVWDLRRSGVNDVVEQNERIVLPRVGDAVSTALHLARSKEPDEELYFLVFDIENAFNNIPVRANERRFTCAAIGGKYLVFHTLVFGSASSPTVWGRFAAWLGRSTAAILRPDTAGLQIYVDDPLLAARGSKPGVVRVFTRALVWSRVCGYPIAYHKIEAGGRIEWIGAELAADEEYITVTLSEARIHSLMDAIVKILKGPVASKKDLRSLCGVCSFVTGLIPTMRPFLSPLWAILSESGRSYDSGAEAAHRGQSHRIRRLPSAMFHTKQAKHALGWILAFLRGSRGCIVRRYPIAPPPRLTLLEIATDACPWGIGGVLLEDSAIRAFFFDKLHKVDLQRFRLAAGDSGGNSVWEALAILVGLRVWHDKLHTQALIRVKSDSRVALAAVLKLASPDPKLNLIAREIALDTAEFIYEPSLLEHIPGVANVVPDILSRFFSPEPKPFPSCLHHLCPTPVPVRDHSFWRTCVDA